MKKLLLTSVLCLLLCTMTTMALANQWGLTGGIYDIVSEDDAYDAYTAAADDGNDRLGDLHVNHAVLRSRYHSQLIAAHREGKVWTQVAASSTAVYQPGDDRGQQVHIAHTEDGFVLIFDERERYTFAWKDGAYVLTVARFNAPSDYGSALFLVEEGYTLWDGEPSDASSATGEAMWRVAPITLERFNVTQLPRTMADVRRMNSVGEYISVNGGVLPAAPEVSSPQRKGVKLPVYTAPSEDSYRASSGKAAVSTADSMKLLGEYNGWTMVEYEVSLRTSRIGFIHADGLMETPVPLSLFSAPLTAARDTFLTDDPHVSQFQQVLIPAGASLTGLAIEGGTNEGLVSGSVYAYVAYEHAGTQIWGYVPLRDLQLPADNTRWDVMESLTGKWQCAGGGSLTDDRMILGSEGDYRFYSYFDDWRMTLTDGGTWRITDCPADAGYQGQPLYEITFVNEANEELRFGLIINSNDVITLCTEEWEGSYERYEYSTYSNG